MLLLWRMFNFCCIYIHVQEQYCYKYQQRKRCEVFTLPRTLAAHGLVGATRILFSKPVGHTPLWPRTGSQKWGGGIPHFLGGPVGNGWGPSKLDAPLKRKTKKTNEKNSSKMRGMLKKEEQLEKNSEKKIPRKRKGKFTSWIMFKKKTKITNGKTLKK